MSRGGPAGTEGERNSNGRDTGPHMGDGGGGGYGQQRREAGEEKRSDVCSIKRALQNDWQAIREEGLRHVSAWMESDLLTIDETCLDMNLISPGDSGVQRSLAGLGPRGRKEMDTT